MRRAVSSKRIRTSPYLPSFKWAIRKWDMSAAGGR